MRGVPDAPASNVDQLSRAEPGVTQSTICGALERSYDGLPTNSKAPSKAVAERLASIDGLGWKAIVQYRTLNKRVALRAEHFGLTVCGKRNSLLSFQRPDHDPHQLQAYFAS